MSYKAPRPPAPLRRFLAIAAVGLVASCLNQDGLDLETGQQAGPGQGGAVNANGGAANATGGAANATGGAGGLGGLGGLGGNGAGGSQCGPVCAIACEFGNVLDERGCPTCACNPRPDTCDPKACTIACQPGTHLVQDEDTCACSCEKDAPCSEEACGPLPPVAPCPGGNGPETTCARNDAGKCAWQVAMCPVCPDVQCDLACRFGFKTDDNGCETCACNPPPSCTKEQCGPAPLVPSMMCADGSTAGPVCARNEEGRCGWTVTRCPACEDAKDLATCEANAACQWLAPGCRGNELPRAGCFSKERIGCERDRDCPDGQECASRTVDHCAGRPDRLCVTCAAPISVCL